MEEEGKYVFVVRGLTTPGNLEVIRHYVARDTNQAGHFAKEDGLVATVIDRARPATEEQTLGERIY
ncbi:MAG: hypothetical protein KJ718_05470 [Nanoarchaeota archaeon]|nr:hypothetical protein [Nanoarchaeota archaeon]MBU1051972.1 hypothetical protein [Nanoarchaeota archaeon]MBU1988655.1 hypothetical protein [Nanoarchaeota archaeon]